MERAVSEELILSGSEGHAAHAEKSDAAGQSSSSALRRLACETCRLRKVRCDRRGPSCSRCVKTGIRCHYPGRAKTAQSKTDLSQFLLALNDRLKQAEAQLAFTSPTRTGPLPPIPRASVEPPLVASNISTSTGLSPFDSTVTVRSAEGQQQSIDESATYMTNPIQPEDRSDGALENPIHSTPIDLVISGTLPCEDQALGVDPGWFDSPSPLLSLPVSTTSPSFMQGFYDRYFEVSHPITPMVNRNRFQSEILQSTPPMEAQLLSYAIALHGAVLMRGLQTLVDRYYDHARNLLDIFERQETGESLANINTLQACILLTAYECKRPNFARSWMTLGRACRLVKIMGFDKASDSTIATTSWGLQVSMSQPAKLADVEEGRRAFWTLYVYEAFASLRTNSSLTFDKPVSVPLPSPHEYPEQTESNDVMPTLEQLFELPVVPVLSAYAGTMVMIHMYQRCFEHVQTSRHDSQHSFWENHYQIEKAIDRCRKSLLTQHITGNSSHHPLALGQRMNLDAVEIALHEAALAKIQKDELPSSLAFQATSKCSLAATDIAEACRLAQQLQGLKLDSLRQVDQFLVWPITMAIQVCFRMLYGGDETIKPYVDCLRVLSTSMKNLIDPEHIPPGLLEKADARVAEAEGLADELWALDFHT